LKNKKDKPLLTTPRKSESKFQTMNLSRNKRDLTTWKKEERSDRISNKKERKLRVFREPN